jgi:transcription elongation factor Elf1
MSKELRCQSCGASLNVKEQRSNIIQCDYCGTECVVEIRGSFGKVDYGRQFVSKLYRAIDSHFTENEMRDLVVELNGKLMAPYFVDYDDLAGGGQRAKARELVQWCQRRKLLQELVDAVHSIRPSIKI